MEWKYASLNWEKIYLAVLWVQLSAVQNSDIMHLWIERIVWHTVLWVKTYSQCPEHERISLLSLRVKLCPTVLQSMSCFAKNKGRFHCSLNKSVPQCSVSTSIPHCPESKTISHSHETKSRSNCSLNKTMSHFQKSMFHCPETKSRSHCPYSKSTPHCPQEKMKETGETWNDVSWLTQDEDAWFAGNLKLQLEWRVLTYCPERQSIPYWPCKGYGLLSWVYRVCFTGWFNHMSWQEEVLSVLPSHQCTQHTKQHCQVSQWG